MPGRMVPQDEGRSMHSMLHDDVARLLLPHKLFFSLQNVDEDGMCIEEYDTNIMGQFACNNPNCRSGGWWSKKLQLQSACMTEKSTTRECTTKAAEDDQLGQSTLDESYADRVAYRLKTWSGLPMETFLLRRKQRTAPKRSVRRM